MKFYTLVCIFCLLAITGCREGPDSDEIAAVKRDIELESQEADSKRNNAVEAISSPLPDCEAWCDPNNPDYRCLFAGGLGTGQDKQLADLVAYLSNPQPVTLPHLDLLKIFDLTNIGYDNARGETKIQSDVMTNEGGSSVLTAKMMSGLVVRIIVPKSIRYSYNKVGSGFTLSETTSNTSFAVDIDDSILHRTYGGFVRGIHAKPERALLFLSRGCVAYDPGVVQTSEQQTSRNMGTLTRRLRAERAAGADSQRLLRVIASYGRASILSKDPCTPTRCSIDCDYPSVACKTRLGETCAFSVRNCIDDWRGEVCG